MDIDEVRSRIVAIRTWAIDHEEPGRALTTELELWADVLRAIAAGADHPPELAAAALESLLVDFSRG